jgi:ribosomal protein L37AE/L43A
LKTKKNTNHTLNLNNKLIMGGYDANFNPPLDDKYKCPVCLSALKDPIQTKCGHRLCSTCFKQIRGGNWYFRCPVDNTWSNHVFEDNAVKREVLSLQVNCDNTNCMWTGELRELQVRIHSLS